MGSRASLVAQRLKHLPAKWETWVLSLSREDPLEKEMVTHSSILAWRIPWTEEPSGLQSTVAKSWTRLSDFTFTLNIHINIKNKNYHIDSRFLFSVQFSSVQSLSRVQLFATP